MALAVDNGFGRRSFLHGEIDIVAVPTANVEAGCWVK